MSDVEFAAGSNSPLPQQVIEDDDYGSDIEFDEELENILVEAESQVPGPSNTTPTVDLEDIIPEHIPSPFEQFRKKGWLSVSDLVGTIWCEVQYDYRLRTLPFLPPSQRPEVITSKEGVSIPVDQAKVEGKERILRRGNKIHKRLEREIHPEEIIVHAVTREDVWGLRFLNMFSALEALLTLGKCRELPVVGFVHGILVMGIIDEVTRHPINADGSTKRNTRSSAPDKTQTSLTTFFSPTKPRPAPVTRERTHTLLVSDSKTRASGTLPKDSDTLAGRFQVMLYKELLDALLLPPANSHSAADASVKGKSASEAILPTESPFSWEALFTHLGLDMEEQFSEAFVSQSRPIIVGNGLRYSVDQARTLRDMVRCWIAYVAALGLGSPNPSSKSDAKGKGTNTGKTEDRLELVYRRAGAKETKAKLDKRSKQRRSTGRSSRRKRRMDTEVGEPPPVEDVTDSDEETHLQRAIAESLKSVVDDHGGTPGIADQDKPSILEVDVSEGKVTAETADGGKASVEDDNAEDDELAWAVEMSLGANSQAIAAEEEGEVILRGSQLSVPRKSSPGKYGSPSSAPSTPSPPSSRSQTPQSDSAPTSALTVETNEPKGKSGSGSIIGRSVFTHSPRRLAAHLSSVLQWWMGEREAIGVSIDETRRCGWCEFEEGCEWRARKADEALNNARRKREGSMKAPDL